MFGFFGDTSPVISADGRGLPFKNHFIAAFTANMYSGGCFFLMHMTVDYNQFGGRRYSFPFVVDSEDTITRGTF